MKYLSMLVLTCFFLAVSCFVGPGCTLPPPYRVALMENGAYEVQCRTGALFKWSSACSVQFTSKEEACIMAERLTLEFENSRRARTVKRVIDCQ